MVHPRSGRQGRRAGQGCSITLCVGLCGLKIEIDKAGDVEAGHVGEIRNNNGRKLAKIARISGE